MIFKPFKFCVGEIWSITCMCSLWKYLMFAIVYYLHAGFEFQKHVAIAKCDLVFHYCNAKEISFYYCCNAKLYAKHKKTHVNSIYIVGIMFFRWGIHLFMSLFLSVHPSVRCAPYLRYCTSSDHNFWKTYVRWWYLQVFFPFFKNFDFLGC